MRIGLISDIHGNALALQVVLNHLAQHPVDQLFCLGDVAALGPEPGAVIRMLRELDCPCILGNHDDFLLNPGMIRQYTEQPLIIEALAWARQRLNDADLQFLRTFRPRLEVDLGNTALMLWHGSPRSHMQNILPTTPGQELDLMLKGCTAPLMAGGHTHIQMLRQHRGMLLVNPGSVGLPFETFVDGESPTILAHAEYATIEISDSTTSVSLHRLPLERVALYGAIEACGSPLRELLLDRYA